jgi:indole-3-glycerol phosphate synthase
MRNASPDVLAAIVGAAHRIVEIRRAAVPESALEATVRSRAGGRGRFHAALRERPAPRIIAECKRRSPSRGVLRRDYDPVALARAYEQAGAAAISVLTEPTFFDGAPDHLRAVRDAVGLPVLRKDFIVDRYQLLEAVAWGADAVLLIVAAMPDTALRALLREAEHLDLAALVEVHDREELARALDAGATLVGVNNRNLRTLDVRTTTAEEMIAVIPDDVLAVAESGLRTADDLSRLSRLGYDAFLVGERLVTAGNPAEALVELLGKERA